MRYACIRSEGATLFGQDCVSNPCPSGLRTLFSWFPPSENTLCYIKYFTILSIFLLLCLYNQLGFLFFSPHTVKHWKCWAWNGIAIYDWALLSPSPSSFTGQKGAGRKCSREKPVRLNWEWNGGRKGVWASELSNTRDHKIYYQQDKSRRDCRGQYGMGEKPWIG